MTLPGAPDQAQVLVATWVNLLPLPEVVWEVQPVEVVGAVVTALRATSGGAKSNFGGLTLHFYSGWLKNNLRNYPGF